MKEDIAKTFMKLMNTYTYQDITIKMICDMIPISRNAFYYHLKNKEKLLIWTCAWNYQRYCLHYHFDVGNSETLFQYIYKYRKFYRGIYRIDEGITLHRCLMEAHKSGTDLEHVQEYTILQEGSEKKINKDIYIQYATSGIASVLTYWVEGNYKIPIKEIARDLTIMLTEPLPHIRDYYVY